MITYEMKSARKWLTNECNIKPAYLQRMVAERKTDKPKMTRKEKEYDLMMPIYISTPRACGRI